MDEIFVFGSNLAGRHGLGSAKWAHDKYGAVYGVGSGRTGQSYAIPTKGYQLEILPLEMIQSYVVAFISYAKEHPELTFQLVRVGCGLSGYKDYQMAPMFKGVGSNVNIPLEWQLYINED